MNRRGSFRLHPLIVAAAALVAANARADTGSLSAPASIAAPLTIVPPVFPSTGITTAVKVRVDLAGVVTPEGGFKLGSAVESDGETTFIEAATESLMWWRFIPATDDEACVAKAQDVKIAVWFEGTSVDPHIFLSLPKASDKSSEPARRYASIETPTTRFPPKLLDMDGHVQVLMHIDSKGDVVAANILSSTPYGAFDSVVLASARRTHVVWKEGQAPAADAKVCMVQPYSFCSNASGNVLSRSAHCTR